MNARQMISPYSPARGLLLQPMATMGSRQSRRSQRSRRLRLLLSLLLTRICSFSWSWLNSIEICDDNVQFKSWTWLRSSGPAVSEPARPLFLGCQFDILCLSCHYGSCASCQWRSNDSVSVGISKKLLTWSLSRCNYWHWGSKLTAIKREREDRQ